MSATESINYINNILLSRIEDKSIFYDCFKDHVLNIEEENCVPSYSYSKFVLTEKLSDKNFNYLKEEVNRLLFLDVLYYTTRLLDSSVLFNDYRDPNTLYNRLFKHYKNKNPEEFMKDVKECNIGIKLFISDLVIRSSNNNVGVNFMIKSGCKVKL
jgi:hypothetical protein